MLKTTSIKPGIPPVVSAYRGRKVFQILCMYKLKLINLMDKSHFTQSLFCWQNFWLVGPDLSLASVTNLN